MIAATFFKRFLATLYAEERDSRAPNQLGFKTGHEKESVFVMLVDGVIGI